MHVFSQASSTVFAPLWFMCGSPKTTAVSSSHVVEQRSCVSIRSVKDLLKIEVAGEGKHVVVAILHGFCSMASSNGLECSFVNLLVSNLSLDLQRG
jgi:hypothetical protein